MLQRQALEDGLLKEPIFTGMSVELVSLHNEPFDLRGITIIENDDRHASVGAVEDNECSAPQTRPDGSEEQPAEALTHPEDQQNIDQQEEEEVKDDNELGETACELEVPKEGDGAAADEVSLVVNDEIGQMPAEDKVDHVEGIEDLQVEGYHDGGVGGEDVCVIEITEGDVDHNAILNETDLKVEDELPHDKKTDASAEVCEIGVDNQTQCDITIGYIENGHVEAGDLALESLNEPIVEAKYDGVNPETEPDNNYEPHNDVFNEEATNMQSAPDEDPTSRDGFMRDNDEMDTMEVAHDTGFLNVDDDEDHEEDDGMQEGDETRLLENSGWSSRTRAVAKYLQTIFDKEAENGKSVVVADKLLAGKTRKEASRMFFETLVLKTRDYIQVEQAKPYESITIKPRPRLTKSIF
ncbi:sister chromatid cohesion 1 protein 4-like [Brassica napus]|uniref:sister chromatid cohesion 1 protein 4-like n=2 Tax=Brassica napus TaxID=3708 RepID=UPI0020789CA7|nr:sister chromatid cohesion 1 protein 4-like [Brassica napus]